MDKHATRLLRRLKRLVAQDEPILSPFAARLSTGAVALHAKTFPATTAETQHSALIPAATAFPALAAAIAAAASGTTSGKVRDSPRSSAMMPPPSPRPGKSPRHPRATGGDGTCATSVFAGNAARRTPANTTSSLSKSLDGGASVTSLALRGSDAASADGSTSPGNAAAVRRCSSAAEAGSGENRGSAQVACRHDDSNAAMVTEAATAKAGESSSCGRRSLARGTSDGASNRAALPSARPASKKRLRAPISLEIPTSGCCDSLPNSPRSPGRDLGFSASPRRRSSRGRTCGEPVPRQPPAEQLLQHLQSLLVARPASQEQEQQRREQLAALNELTMDLLVENVVLAMSKSGAAAAGDAPGAAAAGTNENPRARGGGSEAPVSPPPGDAITGSPLDASRTEDSSSGGNVREENAQNAAVKAASAADCRVAVSTAADADAADAADAAAAVAAVVLLAASAVSSTSDAPSPRSSFSRAGHFLPSAPVPPLVSPSSPSAIDSPSATISPCLESKQAVAVDHCDGAVNALQGLTSDAMADSAPGGREGLLSDDPVIPWDEFLRLVEDQPGEAGTNSACGAGGDTPSLMLVDGEAGELTRERSVSGHCKTGGKGVSDDMMQMQELLSDLMQSPGWREASAATAGACDSKEAAYNVGMDPWMQSFVYSEDGYMTEADGCALEPSLKRIRMSTQLPPASAA
ncbi:hypothetical protein CLOP_g19273 [Closterium sp. NIES-67]|nr:hypothetical protein CLOP_g19273 [Closterium sp. NIES-67]